MVIHHIEKDSGIVVSSPESKSELQKHNTKTSFAIFIQFVISAEVIEIKCDERHKISLKE